MKTFDQFQVEMGQFLNLSQKCEKRFDMNPWAAIPILNEDGAQSYDAHYVHHTAWAARVLAETKPKKHVDIGSLLYFSTILSAFVNIEHYDMRPTDLFIPGLFIGQADLMALPFEDNSIESLSCMHVVEHCGLGRYGDPLDPDGDLKAMRELQRVLAPGGQLLFVVPVGKPEIVFNAHKIYDPKQILKVFEGLEWGLDEPTPGCGCFLFKKVQA